MKCCELYQRKHEQDTSVRFYLDDLRTGGLLTISFCTIFMFQFLSRPWSIFHSVWNSYLNCHYCGFGCNLTMVLLIIFFQVQWCNKTKSFVGFLVSINVKLSLKEKKRNTLVRRKLGMVVAQKNPEFLIFRRGPVTENWEIPNF